MIGETRVKGRLLGEDTNTVPINDCRQSNTANSSIQTYPIILYYNSYCWILLPVIWESWPLTGQVVSFWSYYMDRTSYECNGSVVITENTFRSGRQ